MSPRFPGPQSAAMMAELRRYVLADPYPFGVDLEKSEGMWLATVEGPKLFDWAGYYGSKWIAHNHPRLFEPAYLRRLGFAANNKLANPDFLTRECLDYYRALHEVAPRCMRNERLEIYTVNSGAEAVENMMKYFINLHDRKRGRQPGPRRFIYFDQAFHGRTIFALNVTELTHAP
jgi:L-lysine 6-transaminase